ncbi:MAG: hypothetical protein KKI02_09025, partial [Planctomycetes bacterium]|nr:hypothetical protein [Planctomycetota bacterium]
TIKFDNEIVVTELELTELAGGTTVELVVSGQLLDGTEFGGTDCITIRPVGPQPGAKLGAPEHDEDTPEAAPETTDTERREAEQEAFTTPSVACGFLSPAFLPVAIAGMSLARWRFRRTR